MAEKLTPFKEHAAKAPSGPIDGVVVKPLKVMADERGWLMEIFRCDDAIFEKFGQTYLTVAYPEVVKAWHYHKEQTDHFCCVKGMAKVVLYDGRDGSPTHGAVSEHFIGEKNPVLLRIPKGVMHGFKGIGVEPAFILNVPDQLYDYENPDEFRVPAHDNDIPYSWERKDG